MNLSNIIAAIESGQRVYWKNRAYEVKKDSFGRYNIVCGLNGSCIGLTWTDGKTVNGKPGDFFVVANT